MPRLVQKAVAILVLCAVLEVTHSQLGADTVADLHVSVGKSFTSATQASKLSLEGGNVQIKDALVSVDSLEWSRGDVDIQGSGSLELKAWGDVWPCDSCAAPPTIRGGKLNCGSKGKLFLNSRAKLAAQSCTVRNGNFQLYDKSELHFKSATLDTPCNVAGSDNSKTYVANGPTVCKARCRFNGPAEVKEGGELCAKDEDAVIHVEDKKELRITGGHLSCQGVCAAGSRPNCQIGNDFGKGAKLIFSGPKPSKCSAGVVAVKTKSLHIIEKDHECEHITASVFTGPGKSKIYGKFTLSEKLTCDHAETKIFKSSKLKIKGKGQLIVNAGHTFRCHGNEHEHENCQLPSTHVIGCDSCNKPAALECHRSSDKDDDDDDDKDCKPTVIKGGAKIEIKAKGCLRVKSDAKLQIAGPCETTGAGIHEVESRGEHDCAHESKHAHAHSWFRSLSKLKISSSNGHYICAPGHTLHLAGAKVSHENCGNQDTITIGCDSCGTPAALECHDDKEKTRIEAGAKIDIKVQAKIKVHEKAELLIAGPCKIKGGGEFHVEKQAEKECQAEVRHEQAHTYIKESSKLIISGNAGKYKCAPGHTLHLSGSIVEHKDIKSDNDRPTLDCGDSDNDAAESNIECHPAAVSTKIKAGACIDLKLKSKFHVQQSAKVDFEGDCKIKGAGKVHIEGKAECKAKVEIKAPCEVPSSGELICSGREGKVKISEGKHLSIRGGKCSGDTDAAKAASSASFCVGEASGAETKIKFQVSTNPAKPDCEIDGGRFEVKQTGKIHIEAGAKAVITSETHFIKAITASEGAGSCLVEGHLECDDSHKSEIHHEITGQHTLNCAKPHSYTTINYAASAKATCKADDFSGFKAVALSGRASLKGKLHVDCGSYRPTAPVKLYDIPAGLSGKFDTCTSSSATFKGHIQTTATAVIWHPTLTTCSGTCTVVG